MIARGVRARSASLALVLALLLQGPPPVHCRPLEQKEQPRPALPPQPEPLRSAAAPPPLAEPPQATTLVPQQAEPPHSKAVAPSPQAEPSRSAAAAMPPPLRVPCVSGAPAVPVVELGVAAAHAAMLRGDLNCSTLVASYLARIASMDQRSRLNAVRALAPGAAAAAARLDADATLVAARAGRGRLPQLFCVPLLVKDNFDVEGLATTAGAAALLDNFPRQSASVINQLRSAGALVLAKTNMGEFAFFPSFTLSSVTDEVRNPYELMHTPAGSSGGSAAGVAASFGMAGLGTDTGNSVRGPASHTALAGLRPSLGLVSRAGIVPLRVDRDTAGPMCRSVEDVARLLSSMVALDPGDQDSRRLRGSAVVPGSYLPFLRADALRGVRVGVLRSIADLPGTDSGVAALFHQALHDLQAAGAVLVDDFQITGNELGQDWDPNRGGLGPTSGHWGIGNGWESLWACPAPLRAGLNSYLSLPGATSRFRSLEAIYAARAFLPETQDEIQAAIEADYDPKDYPTPTLRALGYVCGCGFLLDDPCRVEFQKALVRSMDAARVVALVYPTWGRPPLLVGQRPEGYDGNNSPMIAPHTGSPAITVPMGFAGLLPAGISFLGRPFDDGPLLGVAYAYERATHHRRPPPLFPECTAAAEDIGASPAGR